VGNETDHGELQIESVTSWTPNVTCQREITNEKSYEVGVRITAGKGQLTQNWVRKAQVSVTEHAVQCKFDVNETRS